MSFGRMVFFAGLVVLFMSSAAISQGQEITATGKLSRVMAVGGESTGWAIQFDSEMLIQGKRLHSIELQAREPSALQKLENKHVSATGTAITRRGIETGERTILELSSIQEVKPKVNLKGSEWLLENLAGRSALNNVKATLTFPEPGKVSGNGSCNRFFGSAQYGDGFIKLGPLGSTRMSCPEPVMNQESKYLKALAAAERYEMQDFELLLYCKGLEKPLRFANKQPALHSGALTEQGVAISHPNLALFSSGAWRLMDAPSRPASGSIYVFLSNGTLLQTSCGEPYRIARWALRQGAAAPLQVFEDNQLAFTSEILEISDKNLRLRQNLIRSGETRMLSFQRVDGEFVCPDLPK